MKVVVFNQFFRGRIGGLLFKRPADVMQALNVADDHPVLRAVLTLMEAKEQDFIELGAVRGLPSDEAKAELRCVACLQEMAEIILERVEEARKAAG